MENSSSKLRGHGAVRRGAFTVVELLAIIAVLALLVSVRLPALAKVTQRTKQAQCANNLRQFALAIQGYGTENAGRLPYSTMSTWAFDLPVSIANLLAPFGATRSVMYCPAFPEQNSDALWNFAPGIRVIGYVPTFPGTASLIATNVNRTLTTQSFKYTTNLFSPPIAAQRPLVADVTMSYYRDETYRETNRFVGLSGGWTLLHRTSHLNGIMPAGGNIAMLDGHVEWRDFAAMHVRTFFAPYFWW